MRNGVFVSSLVEAYLAAVARPAAREAIRPFCDRREGLSSGGRMLILRGCFCLNSTSGNRMIGFQIISNRALGELPGCDVEDTDIEHLKRQFRDQLDKMLDSDTLLR
jgi:hypothetical protein